MRATNKYIFSGLILFSFTAIIFFMVKNHGTKTPALLIKNHIPIYLEIANTETEREIGLMYRKFMPKNHGMIFIFEKPAVLRFWMKNTLIPLDMIFLNHHKVIAIFDNIPPCKSKNNNCPSYGPDVLADEVIELNAGIAKKLTIVSGEKLTLKSLI